MQILNQFFRKKIHYIVVIYVQSFHQPARTSSFFLAFCLQFYGTTFYGWPYIWHDLPTPTILTPAPGRLSRIHSGQSPRLQRCTKRATSSSSVARATTGASYQGAENGKRSDPDHVFIATFLGSHITRSKKVSFEIRKKNECLRQWNGSFLSYTTNKKANEKASFARWQNFNESFLRACQLSRYDCTMG